MVRISQFQYGRKLKVTTLEIHNFNSCPHAYKHPRHTLPRLGELTLTTCNKNNRLSYHSIWGGLLKNNRNNWLLSIYVSLAPTIHTSINDQPVDLGSFMEKEGKPLFIANREPIKVVLGFQLIE